MSNPPPSIPTSQTPTAQPVLSNTSQSAKMKQPRGSLPKKAVGQLRQWLFEHFDYPYPSDEEKTTIGQASGLSLAQVNNWFVNARVRIWKPMLASRSQNGRLIHHHHPYIRRALLPGESSGMLANFGGKEVFWTPKRALVGATEPLQETTDSPSSMPPTLQELEVIRRMRAINTTVTSDQQSVLPPTIEGSEMSRREIMRPPQITIPRPPDTFRERLTETHV